MRCVALNNTSRVWIQVSEIDTTIWTCVRRFFNGKFEILFYMTWISLVQSFRKNEFISMDIVPMGSEYPSVSILFFLSITMSLAWGKDVGWCGEVESFYPSDCPKVDFCWIYFYLIF